MKNSIITAILAFCCMPIMAQTGSGDTAYEVKGTCPTDIAKVYVIDLMKGVTDSTETKNGTFEIKGSNKKDAFLGIAAKGSSSYIVFINDGTPVSADLATMTLKGSELNNKLNGYDRQLDAINGEVRKYIEQPLIRKKDIEERLDAVAELKDQAISREEIREYLSSVYDLERLMCKITSVPRAARLPSSMAKDIPSSLVQRTGAAPSAPLRVSMVTRSATINAE